MFNRHFKKFGFITAGILIILALIFGIIFLIKFSSQKNSHLKSEIRDLKSSSALQKQPIPILTDYTPKYLDLTKYKTDQGELKNVDTTIVTTTNDKDYKYANTTNNFKTFFGNDIKIQKDDSSITFQILTNLTINDQDQSSNLNFKNSLTIKNRVVYSSVYKKDNANIDIAYNVQNDKLSEEIILNQYLGSPKISQNLKLNNVYSKIENKRINFYSQSTNKLLWFIPQPKMYEQKNQNIFSNDLEIQLEYIDSSTIKLTKIINPAGQKWLADPKRQYPIIIDPDFQIDSADTAANWASSDATNFTVSQETTIKHEGTGSVKIVAVGTTGYWDSGCTTSYYTTYGYSGCSSSACGGNCGTTTSCPTCNGSCTAGSSSIYYSPYTLNSISPCSSPPVTVYNYSGTCGSGGCYIPCTKSTYYLPGCSTAQMCGSPPASCTWCPQRYSYSLSGSSTTIYIPNGSVCNSDGSGNCYKPTSTGSGYTSAEGCGGSGCIWTSSYGSMPACTWFANSSLNDTATVTKSPTNLANSKSITFWVYASRTGSYMRFQMGEAASAEQTYDFTISSANTWEQKTWDITGITAGSRDGIQYFAFKNTDASVGFTFYFDDIQALAAAPNPPSVCVISESPTDTYLIPKWVDNSSDENGFQLERNPDAAGFSFLTNLAAGITGYQDNSISSGHTYAYRVRSYKTGVGSTDFSAYCTHPTLDLHTGNFKFEGVKMEGVKIN